MAEEQRVDVVVVGGGIIGLSVAWRACARGMTVTVLERDATGQATSHVAAGMLAPVSEVEFGAAGRRQLDLGLRSAELWPAFASELEEVAGLEVGLMRISMLLLAGDEDRARELERQLAFRVSLGLRVERLRPSQAREREPALAPTMRLALEVPDDHSVDPRLVLAALRIACASVGVNVREHAPVARIELDSGRVSGVSLADGERVSAKQVVLAAGPWSDGIEGVPAGARVPVRPVKGQILRLRDPAGPGLLQRAVRFDGGYMVPRADGRYVLGATVEERGFAAQPSVGGVYELLRHTNEVLPGISELEIEELSVGFRPGTPDNAPAVGPSGVPGLTWATGHYRNGILLAPLTAEMVVAVLEGADLSVPAAPEHGPAHAPARGEEERSLSALLSICAPARFMSDPDSPARARTGPVGAVP